MILGIDASNIHVGGGLTHLKEILRSVDVENLDIEKIVIWSSENTLNQIEERHWLKKCTKPVMEKNYLQRALWQHKKKLPPHRVRFHTIPQRRHRNALGE